jgi:hypothetical protein
MNFCISNPWLFFLSFPFRSFFVDRHLVVGESIDNDRSGNVNEPLITDSCLTAAFADEMLDTITQSTSSNKNSVSCGTVWIEGLSSERKFGTGKENVLIDTPKCRLKTTTNIAAAGHDRSSHSDGMNDDVLQNSNTLPSILANQEQIHSNDVGHGCELLSINGRSELGMHSIETIKEENVATFARVHSPPNLRPSNGEETSQDAKLQLLGETEGGKSCDDDVVNTRVGVVVDESHTTMSVPIASSMVDHRIRHHLYEQAKEKATPPQIPLAEDDNELQVLLGGNNELGA